MLLLSVSCLHMCHTARTLRRCNYFYYHTLFQALAEAAERARELQMFVAMAPEGTRSKTGQLGPFKKARAGELTQPVLSFCLFRRDMEHSAGVALLPVAVTEQQQLTWRDRFSSFHRPRRFVSARAPRSSQ